MSQAVLAKPDCDVEEPYTSFCLKMLPAIKMTEDQFFDFCQQNDEIRFERTAKGELLVMPLLGGDASSRNLTIIGQLYLWATRDQTGKGFSSIFGYTLPNGAVRAPSASWVLRSRLAGFSRKVMEKFIPLCPDFVVEVLSPSDGLRQTKAKMEEYMENGARLGWLIDPQRKQVFVYRPQQAVEVLDNPTTLSGDPELAGYVLDLDPVWRP